MPDTATTAPAPSEAERKLGFALVPTERVGLFAPLVMEKLRAACEFSGGRFMAEYVLAACAGQDPGWSAQLWVAGHFGHGVKPTLEAVAVTCISNYPTGLRVLEVVLVAGENRAWLQFEDEFIAWAREQGCQRIQQIGRRGWARTLSDAWKQSAVMFERDIEPLSAEVARG